MIGFLLQKKTLSGIGTIEFREFENRILLKHTSVKS